MSFSVPLLFFIPLLPLQLDGVDFYHRLIQFYFAVHFFLVGPAVFKIEYDVRCKLREDKGGDVKGFG